MDGKYAILEATPPQEILEIIYQDEDLVAINKPANLLVHRSWIDKDETRFAMTMLRDQLGQYVYPVHRLDKPTSGVLLFALSSEIARALSEQIKKRDFDKTYLAVVRGYIEASGEIDYPLKEILDKMTDKFADKNKAAQSAITSFKKLAEVELPYAVGRYSTTRYSLVYLHPKTGRKHQLRRHMKHLLHPIVGDTKYGRGEHNRFFRSQYNSHRLLLHAYELCFIHPVLKKEIYLKASLDATYLFLIQEFGWNNATIASKSSYEIREI